MDETPDERDRRYDVWMASFAAMMTAQHEKNQRLDTLIEQQAEFNRDVKTTLARLEALTARVFRQDPNGTDA